MESLEETLSARIDTLIESTKSRALLDTTGERTAIAEVVSRLEGLELAIREIALEVERHTIPRGD